MDLRPSHLKVLSFLEDRYRQGKTCPTIREIGEACGKTNSPIQNSLKVLESAGMITRSDEKQRNIILTNPPKRLSNLSTSKALSQTKNKRKDKRSKRKHSKYRAQSLHAVNARIARSDTDSQIERISVKGGQPRGLPIYGDVAAGLCHIPAEADLDSNFSNFFDFAQETQKADYLLRISGESMIGAGILDNALVGVRSVPDNYLPKEGEIVVVLINGEGTTLKYFYQEGDIVVLKPANPDPEFKPLVYDTKLYEIKIQGVHVFTFNP